MKTIKEIREDAGFSRAELSRLVGVPYHTMEGWESGRRNPPAYVIAMIEQFVQNYIYGQEFVGELIEELLVGTLSGFDEVIQIDIENGQMVDWYYSDQKMKELKLRDLFNDREEAEEAEKMIKNYASKKKCLIKRTVGEVLCDLLQIEPID